MMVSGATKALPMPLTVRSVTDVVEAHPVSLPRDILDSCVFALDEIYLTDHDK